MFEIIAPITVGSALVLLVDFIRKMFPSISSKGLKLVTIGLAGVFATILYFAQNNANIEKYLQMFLSVLGTSQTLFSLYWKNSTIRESIVRVGEQTETTEQIG